MAIADKLTRLAQTKSEIKAALIAKGSDPGSAPFKDYPGLIESIQTGGGDDTSIEDALVQRTLTEYSNNRVTKVGDSAFYSYTSLTTASLPAATSVGSNAFNNCKKLTTVNLPAVRSIEHDAFQNCSSLTTVNFPVAINVGSNAFNNCKKLTTVNLPAVRNIAAYTFDGCSSLTIVDLPLTTSILIYAFRDCYSLTTLVLRNTTEICTLTSVTFTNCYHYYGTVNSTYNPEGLQDGYIYVPANLIKIYKVTKDWSTFATQFRALEDYTVDGTTTGELDESKI